LKPKKFWRPIPRTCSVRLLIGVALVLISFVACAQDYGTTPIGFVARLQGKWVRVSDGKELITGDVIFPNTTVRTKELTESSIRIAMFDGTVWTQKCVPQPPCDAGSYAVPSPSVDQHGFLSFLASYFSAKRKVPIIFAASRSVDLDGLKDELLEIKGQTIPLSGILQRIPSGRLRLTLSEPISGKMGPSEEVDWPNQSTMHIGNLPPGLYALDVYDQNNQRIGEPVAVLLLDSTKYPHALSEFRAASALAEKWDDIDSISLRSFLICTLYAIDLEARE
jgi:hypothetical protein